MLRCMIPRIVFPSLPTLLKTWVFKKVVYKPIVWKYDIQKRLLSTDDVSKLENELPVPDWEVMDLHPIKKDFFTPHKDVIMRSEEEIKQYRLQHDVIVSCPSGFKIPRPVQHITEANFPEYINEVLIRKGLEVPTVTPAQGWPILMSGFNMVGIGENTPYKVLTYMLPAIIHIKNQPPMQKGDGPIMLVLAPNKSITQEVKAVADTYGISAHIKSTDVFDEGAKSIQARRLMMDQQIVIGTPKRILHFLKKKVINLKRTSYLVLDEIDNMLETEMESYLQSVMSQIRPDRQMSVWSTFWSKEVQLWLDKVLQKNYIRMDVRSLSVTPNTKVEDLDSTRR